MQNWYQRLQFDRLIVLSAITTVGVLFASRADMPLLIVAVVILLGVVVAALRQIVGARREDAVWMLAPILLTLASALFWRTIPDERASLLGSALFGILFFLAIMEYHRNRFSSARRTVSWQNQAIVYIALAMLFVTLDTWNLHIALQAALAAVVGHAGITSILFREQLPRAAIHTYSLLTALIVGEIAWALSYWPLPSFQEALALLLHVHVVLGLARAHHAKKIGLPVVLEYGAVGAITWALLLWTVFRPLA